MRIKILVVRAVPPAISQIVSPSTALAYAPAAASAGAEPPPTLTASDDAAAAVDSVASEKR